MMLWIQYTRKNNGCSACSCRHGNPNCFSCVCKQKKSKCSSCWPEQKKRDENRQGDLYSARLFRSETATIPFWMAMYLFHTTPFVKFCYHSISHLVYLGVFSYFLLTDLRPEPVSTFEYIIYGWTGTIIMDELRQMCVHKASYFHSQWNLYDLLTYGLFIVSVILRWTLPTDAFVWARMFYVLTLTLLFVRGMQLFFVNKHIGPKVVMIKKMLTDLVFFLLILGTVISSYGVAKQALVYPNSSPSWDILRKIASQPYWNIYGELFIDELLGDVPGCSNNATLYESDPDIPRCPTVSWLAILLTALYFLLTNVLLLNLLIAMFSYTFGRVQEKSETVWRFHRYGLVYEYYDKPTLAPPLIVFSHLWRLFKYCKCCCNKPRRENSAYRCKLGVMENQELTAFERAGMEDFLIWQHQHGAGDKVGTESSPREKKDNDIEQLKEQIMEVVNRTKMNSAATLKTGEMSSTC